MGFYLRVAWICLLFNAGSCFPVDYRDYNMTSFSSPGSLEFSDLEYLDVSLPGNESSPEATSAAAETQPTLEPDEPDLTSEPPSSSSMPVSAPRTFHRAHSKDAEEEIPGASMAPKLVPGAAPPSPWYGPPFFHEGMHAGAGSYPYSSVSSNVGFPHHSYPAPPPYDYTYGTAFSPYYNYAYGLGGSFHHGYVAPGYPPVGHGTTRTAPPYGYFPQQPPIIDPELLLIGNILMRIRQMPLGQAWRASEEHAGVYPFSHVVQPNSNYHHERDLHSISQYSENPSDPSPEPEVQQTQQNVPITDF